METNSPIYINLDFTKSNDYYALQIDISQLATSKLVMEGKETKYFNKDGKEIFSIEEVNNKKGVIYYLSIPQKLFFQELLTEEHFNHINHVISANYDMDFDPSDSYTTVYKKKNTKSEQEELFMNKDISQSEITNSLDSLITTLNKNRKVYFLVNNKVKKGKIKNVKIILTKTPTIIYEIYCKKKNTIYYINSREILYSTF